MALQKKLLITGFYSFIMIASALFYAVQKNQFEVNPPTQAIPINSMVKGKAIEPIPSDPLLKQPSAVNQEVAIEVGDMP